MHKGHQAMAKLAIRPLEDRVVIQQIEAEEKTAGGIVLPDTAKEKPQRGKVLAVGPGKLLDSGERAAIGVIEGDEVLSASTRVPRSRWTARRSRSFANPTSWPRSSSDTAPQSVSIPNLFEEQTSVAKQLIFSDAGRRKMLGGVDTLAKAVGSTLGPTGRNVILSKSFGGPLVTKDGVTVSKEIELNDPFENMGAKLVNVVASKTSDVAGDGTTTATILARAIYREGLRNVTSGANPTAVRRGIEKAVEVAVNELRDKLSR